MLNPLRHLLWEMIFGGDPFKVNIEIGIRCRGRC